MKTRLCLYGGAIFLYFFPSFWALFVVMIITITTWLEEYRPTRGTT